MQTINFDEMTIKEIEQHIIDIWNGTEPADDDTFRAFKQERMRRLDKATCDERGVFTEEYRDLLKGHFQEMNRTIEAVRPVLRREYSLDPANRAPVVYGYTAFRFPEAADDHDRLLFAALITISLNPKTKLNEILVREEFTVHKTRSKVEFWNYIGRRIHTTGLPTAFDPLKEKLFLSNTDLTILHHVRSFADTRKLGIGTIEK